MAELTVQPKKKPIWPWLLLLLIIAAAAIYFYMAYTNQLPAKYDVVPATKDSAAGAGTMHKDTVHRTDTIYK